MTSGTKLVVLGAAIGAVVALGARRRARVQRPLDIAPADPGMVSDRGASAVAVPSGLSDVDPQPITQVAAEAVDPDAIAAAHDDIIAQRERLPIPGKNLP